MNYSLLSAPMRRKKSHWLLPLRAALPFISAIPHEQVRQNLISFSLHFTLFMDIHLVVLSIVLDIAQLVFLFVGAGCSRTIGDLFVCPNDLCWKATQFTSETIDHIHRRLFSTHHHRTSTVDGNEKKVVGNWKLFKCKFTYLIANFPSFAAHYLYCLYSCFRH